MFLVLTERSELMGKLVEDKGFANMINLVPHWNMSSVYRATVLFLILILARVNGILSLVRVDGSSNGSGLAISLHIGIADRTTTYDSHELLIGSRFPK